MTEDQQAADRIAAIANDPRYRDLVATRGRFGWLLAGIMMTVYFGYILLVAFRKDWLAQPIAGGVTSVGIPLGIGVILTGIILTGLYIRRANRQFDPMLDAICREHGA